MSPYRLAATRPLGPRWGVTFWARHDLFFGVCLYCGIMIGIPLLAVFVACAVLP